MNYFINEDSVQSTRKKFASLDLFRMKTKWKLTFGHVFLNALTKVW